MGTARSAFGVNSIQRRPGAIPLEWTRFGYKTPDGIFLAKDKFYIEIAGSDDTAELAMAMEKTVKNLSEQISAGESEIAELRFFPQSNLLPHSLQFKTSDVFGFAGLTDTFVGKYRFDGDVISAFFSKRDSAHQAGEIAKSYYKFLIDNGGTNRVANADGVKGRIVDLYGKVEIVFSNGVFVAGVHQADSQRTAEKAAKMLNEKLSKVTVK